ncbi:MAG: tetratricopeptide repeat protein [Planctomycetota bacterium]|jgi:tetratricopeptide (TPR) repeat protein
MFKSKALLVLCSLVFCCTPGLSGQPLDSERLSSASVGQIFFEIAYDLAHQEDTSPAQFNQSIIFLTSVISLDSNADYVIPVLIKLICENSDRDLSNIVYHLLSNYVEESDEIDLEPARIAIRYLLEQLNSREERERLLEDMLKNLGRRNAVLGSELATSLGLLLTEKPDVKSALPYLIQAYNDNKYNKLAFAKLVELMPEQIAPAMYLEHLRLAVIENPTDLETALKFSQYAEQMQLYEVSAGTYEYCADLYSFLYPSQTLPARIYLPWAMNCYNTERNQPKCLQISDRVRKDGRFDLLLEAIAGKAAAKTDNANLSRQILLAAEAKVYAYIANRQSDQLTQTIDKEEIAWFYCFALADPNKALDWANKAYSIDPKSATTAALLAYSLVMNGQTEWAKLLIGNYQRNQIADLTLAQIQLREGQKETAIQTLKSAITKDPGSFAAEKAKELLVLNGGEYIPTIDPGTSLVSLKNAFGQSLVPKFINPEKMITAQLNLKGSKFSYGSDLGGTVEIRNNSSQPIVVSDDGVLKGYIRIDASIYGDLQTKIQNLVSIKIGPGSPIKPGRSLLVPIHLLTGELRQILLTYPQASLDIEFTLYLDPAMTADGQLTNSLPGLQPAKTIVKRSGMQLTGKFLQNRLGSLTRGRQGQKIKTAQLFTGLLREQHAIAGSKPPYKMMSADWMPTLLSSALIHNLTLEDWVTKVHTMAGMLSLPLDYELTSPVGKNLNDTHWPARLMALYLLADSQGSDFKKVLDWTANYDSNKLVRDMAIALGAAAPKPKEPANSTTTRTP